MTRKISKTRYITIAAHVMCWAAYIFLPYFSAVFRNEDPSRFNLFGSILFTLPLLVIFYANYSFLAPGFTLGSFIAPSDGADSASSFFLLSRLFIFLVLAKLGLLYFPFKGL